uniref:C2H2-type domain-containing protein n=2 Tax=Brassica oleracea TaxID=3712 RepID=A0A0D3BEX4_BRAOL
MSSSHNNTNSSSSYTQSPLPDGGATTGANNLNREERGRGRPNNPTHPLHQNPEAEVIALRVRTFMETHRFKCSVCGKRFRTEKNRNLHRSEHNLPWRRFSI